MSASLLTRREMFAFTYQSLLAVLHVFLHTRGLWTCKWFRNQGLLINNQLLQRDALP